MQEELNPFERNNVLKLVLEPKDKHIISENESLKVN